MSDKPSRMDKKFGSVYFAADKSQTLGPQARAHAWADTNCNTFFVMYESGLSPDGKTSFYEFASYKNLPAFLDVYNKLQTRHRCFFEQIREGYPCCEYYDIDWELALPPNADADPSASEDGASSSVPSEDTDTIAQLEKRVFDEFLAARNRYAPKYPVTENQRRVLTSSTHSKISLHIMIPTNTFENNHRHLRTFLIDLFDDIKAAQDQNGNSIRVADAVPVNKQPSSTCRAIAPRPTNAPVARGAQANTDAQVSLPQSIVDAVHSLFIEFERGAVQNELIKLGHVGQYKMQYDNNGTIFKLQRDHGGHCVLCKRENECDNGYLKLQV
ncbi:hypothetical protein BGX26_002765 [Mortierella sp. AD094]|nr:hypothetical protein BGX26_002765 [Mortierella sp. AD094]